jgi:hypothetical protein
MNPADNGCAKEKHSTDRTTQGVELTVFEHAKKESPDTDNHSH